MQQYDDDPDVYVDSTRVLSDTCHVARKGHTCDGCVRSHIQRGERYRQTVMLDEDGRFVIVRQCLSPCPYPHLLREPGPAACASCDPDAIPF